MKELLFVLTNEKTLFDTAPERKRAIMIKNPGAVNSPAERICDWVHRTAAYDKWGVPA
jgi:hypothetical protein